MPLSMPLSNPFRRNHAGHGEGEGGDSGGSSDTMVLNSQPSEKSSRKPKRNPESPTESLYDGGIAGADKVACRRTESVTAKSVDSSGPSSEVSVLLQDFRREIREDIRDFFSEILSNMQKHLDAAENTIREQEVQLRTLTKANDMLLDKVQGLNKRVADLEDWKSSLDRHHTQLGRLEEEVQALSKKGESVQNEAPPPPPATVVLDMVEAVAERQLRRNNVVIRGLSSAAETDLVALISNLVPDLPTNSVLSATFIKPRSAQAKPDSKLVRAVLTAAGKKSLLSKKKQAEYDGSPVYIQHDLTKQEQARRRAVVPQLVPQLKELRKKGIKCHLPRDVILVDGKELSNEEVASLLQSA